MNRALLHGVALLLPLLGLGGMWLQEERLSRQGTEWDVPIQGYDPRDLLQGHYVQFQYDWPASNLAEPERVYGVNALCLTGTAPTIARVRIRRDDEDCTPFVREGEGSSGRLYASQGEALRLQRDLRDPTRQGVVRIRLRPDGHLTPLRISFRPRAARQPASP
ncbi:GDYXXLXY motif protein [Novosphingobium kunmingense]|uniref:GDYXXLXY motif protein n=1 Tax=Novosphingobium kunmingense TaxID=1211806 RepID=A0A2N0H7C3_9SPHN|nr:GDYXXLXY domain-containing protein [Novosphingobium kunmingense]PKB14842.1 GDYXXLXY motif protein [Novosphingobium kunmingense]